MTEFTIRHATIEDIEPLFKFLCVISQPVLHAEIHQQTALAEMARVIREDFALVTEIDGEIVGSLGIMGVDWWYAKRARFLTDRWFFVYPQVRKLGASVSMLGEAGAIAYMSEMDVLINGHIRRRCTSVGRGVLFTKPQFIAAEDLPQTDWAEIDRNVIMET